MITCSGCGAIFHKEETKCPYCGQIYIPGAQKDYINKLYEIREDMAEVENLSEKVYHGEIRKNVKITGVILAVVFLLILGILGLFLGMKHLTAGGEKEEDIKKRILWERNTKLQTLV